MVVVGGIYSPNHYSSRCYRWAHRTWHCSLSGACHVSWPLGFGAVDRWSPLSSCGTGQSGGTPDSPVAHRTVRWHTGQSGVFWLYSFDFWLLHCSLFLRQHSRPLAKFTVAPLAHRTVWCTSDSSANYSGVTQKTRERPVREVPWPMHRIVSGAPLAAPILVFAPNLVELPNSFSLLVYVELYAPEINDN
jgi:hypothetical protein